MRPLPLFRLPAALLALPLAFWSALPTIRWCGDDGRDVQVACFIPCVAAFAGGSCAPSAEPAVTCDGGVCPGAADEAAACAAPSGCDDSAALPCGLAFCLDGPTGGDGVPAEGRAALTEPPSVVVAVLIATLAAPAAPECDGWAAETRDDAPASITRARSHPARAPPGSV